MKYLIVLLLAVGSCLRAATLPQSTTYYVALSWQAAADQTDPTVGYDIYRSISGKNSFSELNSGLITPTSYDDFYILYGVSYDYYVTSVDANGVQGSPSNTFSLMIPFVPYAPVVGSIK